VARNAGETDNIVFAEHLIKRDNGEIRFKTKVHAGVNDLFWEGPNTIERNRLF